VQSARATNLAAGKEPVQFYIKTTPVPTPAEFPKMLYNAKDRTTKLAQSSDDEQKLEGQGYSKDPFPAEDPSAVTPDDIKALAAAGEAIVKVAQKLEQLQSSK
jgi:hypothetical protein